MAAKRSTERGPRRRGEPGRPSGRRGPDPAEVARDYVRDDDADELEPRAGEEIEDGEEIPSGTVQDQLVYQNLDENRVDDLPPPSDPKRSRKRSSGSARTVGKRQRSSKSKR